MTLRRFGLTGVNLDDISTWTLDKDKVELQVVAKFVVNQDSLVMVSDHDSKLKYPNHTEVEVGWVSTVLTITFRSDREKTLLFRGIMADRVFDSLCNGAEGDSVSLSEEELKAADAGELRSFRAIRLEFHVNGDPPDLSIRKMLDMMWANYTADEAKELQYSPPSTVLFTNMAGEKLQPDTHVSQAPDFVVGVER